MKLHKTTLLIFTAILVGIPSLTAMKKKINLRQSIISNIDENNTFFTVQIAYKKTASLSKGVKLHNPIDSDGTLKIKMEKIGSINNIFKKFEREKEKPFLLYVKENFIFFDKTEKYELIKHKSLGNFSLIVLPENTNPKIIMLGTLAAAHYSNKFCFV